MGNPLLVNDARSTLASSVGTEDTSITVQGGDAAKFPAPTGGQWCPVTVIKTDGSKEIMRLTARSGAVLTVTREQEGTSALAFDSGDLVAVRFTAGVVAEMLADLASTYTPQARTLTAGNGLSGGGDLSANRSFALDYANQAEAEAGTDGLKAMAPATTDQAIQALAPLPPGHIYGCTLGNNETDADNDIDIAAGRCRDATDAHNITLSALTKRLDAGWAVGTNQGMRIGSLADGWWREFAIKRSDTGVCDVAAAQSASPTLPENYDYKRQIGWIYRDSGAILAFIQIGDEFRFTGEPPLLSEDIGTSAEAITVRVPPSLFGHFRAGIKETVGGSGVDFGLFIRNPDMEDDNAASWSTARSTFGEHHGAFGGGDMVMGGSFDMFVDASSQLEARATSSSASLRLASLGWTDTRGRLAA